MINNLLIYCVNIRVASRVARCDTGHAMCSTIQGLGRQEYAAVGCAPAFCDASDPVQTQYRRAHPVSEENTNTFRMCGMATLKNAHFLHEKS